MGLVEAVRLARDEATFRKARTVTEPLEPKK
jgi:hypothetical protein